MLYFILRCRYEIGITFDGPQNKDLLPRITFSLAWWAACPFRQCPIASLGTEETIEKEQKRRGTTKTRDLSNTPTAISHLWRFFNLVFTFLMTKQLCSVIVASPPSILVLLSDFQCWRAKTDYVFILFSFRFHISSVRIYSFVTNSLVITIV